MLNMYFDDLIKSGGIVSIFDDRTTDKFLAGSIVAINEDYIVLSHITPNGLYDGFIMLPVDSIYRIETNSKYNKKIEILYKVKEQKHPSISLHIDNLPTSMLEYAQNSSCIVSIYLHDDNTESIQGYIDKIENSFVFIKQINTYGEEDGCSTIPIDDITFISCDSTDDSDLAILYEHFTTPPPTSPSPHANK